MKPARVRFYLDADILGLARLLVTLRPDMTYPGDPGGVVHKRQRSPCTISRVDTPDTVWIPECARQGWLIANQWRAIERCVHEEGPFIYSATRTTMRRIKL